jgi:DNA-binding MarR family transcriptional regulator
VTIDQAVERIQFAYPQIYFACHTRHERTRSRERELSARDSQILVHLDREIPSGLTALAAHLDLALSTVSEAIKHLTALGYVEKRAGKRGDRRAVGLTLTEKGAEAVRSTSVLEPARLAAVLRRLKPADRRRAIDGLAIFADACRSRS